LQRFVNGRDGVGAAILSYHGEADAIVGDALVHLQFMRDGRGNGEMLVGTLAVNFFYGTGSFYDSSKHWPVVGSWQLAPIGMSN